ELLSRPAWGLDDAQRFLGPLHSLNAAALAGPLQSEVMAYSFYLAAQQAIWRGYSPLVAFLLHQTRSGAREEEPPLHFLTILSLLCPGRWWRGRSWPSPSPATPCGSVPSLSVPLCLPSESSVLQLQEASFYATVD